MSISESVKEVAAKYGILGEIVFRTVSQFKKWHKSHPNLTEQEVALNLFMERYIKTNRFEGKEKNRIDQYVNSDFKFDNLLDYCLVSLDIEGGIRPSSEQSFFKIASLLEEIMEEVGYSKKIITDHKGVFESLNQQQSRISHFMTKWSETIQA